MTGYLFKCPNCNAKGEIMVGRYRFGREDYELASCEKCKRLTHTTDRKCPFCGSQAETNKWFSKKTGFKIIDEINISKIPCPKCGYKYILHGLSWIG